MGDSIKPLNSEVIKSVDIMLTVVSIDTSLLSTTDRAKLPDNGASYSSVTFMSRLILSLVLYESLSGFTFTFANVLFCDENTRRSLRMFLSVSTSKKWMMPAGKKSFSKR